MDYHGHIWELRTEPPHPGSREEAQEASRKEVKGIRGCEVQRPNLAFLDKIVTAIRVLYHY